MSKTANDPKSSLETGLAVADDHTPPPEEADTKIVDWDGPDDPANPLNWPSRKRWAHIIMVSLLGLVR